MESETSASQVGFKFTAVDILVVNWEARNVSGHIEMILQVQMIIKAFLTLDDKDSIFW